jgi:hypothetical protein
MTDKEFTRSLILATIPRLDGYDSMRMGNWRLLYHKRYGRHLPRPGVPELRVANLPRPRGPEEGGIARRPATLASPFTAGPARD